MLLRTRSLALPVALLGLLVAPAVATADNVVPEDQIVQGSQCVGNDCVNGEVFDFDTLRLKENNTRIGFDDTSTGMGFAANDWQLTANDAANPGTNFFSIDDVTGAKTPFKVMAGAPTNSLFVDPLGKVGIGTDTPGLALGLNAPDTPGIRLAQSGGGFMPQTWDVAGNEANFFVRDLTGGSRLPFRIRPGAPTSSIDIAASGNVGVGTAAPAAALEVKRDGGAQVRVEDTAPTTAPRTLGMLLNNGPAALQLVDTDLGTGWEAGTTATSGFALSPTGGLPALSVTPNGTVSSAQAVQQGADPATQTDVTTVDPATVLDAVKDLPLQQFAYTTDTTGAKHLAPEGAAFRSALGLGSSDTALSPGDVAAVSLAAVQALAAGGGGSGSASDPRVPGLIDQIGTLRSADQTQGDALAALKLEQANAAGAVTLLRTADHTLRDRADAGTRAQVATDARVRSLQKSNAAMAKRVKALEAAVKRLSAKK